MIPKAELHVHLEGTIPPDLVIKLAQRNRLDVPSHLFGPNNTLIFKDFQDFLQVYDAITQVISTEDDYRDITFNYLSESAKQGVIYSEITVSPDHAFANGMSYQAVLDGVTQGIKDAEKKHGIVARILIAHVRHFGVDKCSDLIQLVIKHPHPHVIGISLVGDEVGFPARLFNKVFNLAHDAGLGCTAHAGERTGPESIWETIKELPITRIGHGVRSIEDIDLIKEIKDHNLVLECAPTGNIVLGLYPDYQHHPFLQLYKEGVKLTLNSDDPPFFGTSIAKEYEIASKEFGLNDQQLKDITRTAIQASFTDDQSKQTLLKKLD